MERGYIKETTKRSGTLYWVTKGSGTNRLSEAGLFTRAEFDALHPTTRAALEFVPVPNGSAQHPASEVSDRE